MSGLTIHPSLGWIAGIAIACIMVLLTVLGPIVYYRTKADTDTNLAAVIRRSAITLLIALLALTPSQVKQVENKAVNATDIYIAVDVTGSMAVQDSQYGTSETLTRLETSKRAVNDIVNSYPAASFSAIRFGASTTTDLPITPDSRAVTIWAQNLITEPTSVSTGSSLDAPIDTLTLALKERKDQYPDHRIVLYFITDGEQTNTKHRQSYTSLRAYLDNAFVVGVGSSAGNKIPMSADSPDRKHPQTERWVIDPQTGKPGISKMDEKELKAIADEMSGQYVPTNDKLTINNTLPTKSSSHYQVEAQQSKHERITAVTWPIAFMLLGLLLWEMVDWIISSRRML